MAYDSVKSEALLGEPLCAGVCELGGFECEGYGKVDVYGIGR